MQRLTVVTQWQVFGFGPGKSFCVSFCEYRGGTARQLVGVHPSSLYGFIPPPGGEDKDLIYGLGGHTFKLSPHRGTHDRRHHHFRDFGTVALPGDLRPLAQATCGHALGPSG